MAPLTRQTRRRRRISRHGRRGSQRQRNVRLYYAIGGAVAAILIVTAGFLVIRHGSVSTTAGTPKPIILYVNQGNGAVNQTNFGSMLSFSVAHGFNTIFFQVYRAGSLLFQPAQLASFAGQAHAQGLKIFFALYFTESSQQVPSSVFTSAEDGISLDMSGLPLSTQSALLVTVREGLRTGQVAVTTTDLSFALPADMIVLETYGPGDQAYIHRGVVGSVGVFATSSGSDYEQRLQYALQNGDGVMVFDYAGLMKSGY